MRGAPAGAPPIIAGPSIQSSEQIELLDHTCWPISAGPSLSAHHGLSPALPQTRKRACFVIVSETIQGIAMLPSPCKFKNRQQSCPRSPTVSTIARGDIATSTARGRLPSYGTRTTTGVCREAANVAQGIKSSCARTVEWAPSPPCWRRKSLTGTRLGVSLDSWLPGKTSLRCNRAPPCSSKLSRCPSSCW